MDHFDSNRGEDPPRSDLPLRPITPRGLPPPDAHSAQHQHRARETGFGKEVQWKIVRRSPDFSEPRERGIEPQFKRGAGELADAHPSQGSARKRTQRNEPSLQARLDVLARGGEYASERAFSRGTERQQVIEPRHREMRNQREDPDAVSGEPPS